MTKTFLKGLVDFEKFLRQRTQPFFYLFTLRPKIFSPHKLLHEKFVTAVDAFFVCSIDGSVYQQAASEGGPR